MNNDDNEVYIPLIVFPEQDPLFSYGFEAGSIWQRLLEGIPYIGEKDLPIPISVGNKELYVAMAKFFNYTFEWQTSNVEGWLTATFVKNQPKEKIKLSLVKKAENE